MPFQIKQNTLNLSVPIERLAGAYYRIQRTKQNISLSCLAKELRMNKGFLSDLENGKRHFPDGLSKQIDSILNTNFMITAALQKSDEITMDELAILCEQAGTEGIKTLKR